MTARIGRILEWPLERWTRWWRRRSPPGLFVASFVLLIAAGTAGLLWLPGLYVGERLSFVDSLFTMTSAVCVTGLIVADTATRFTQWGQLWILIFIQLGGLGLITITTLLIGSTGRKLSLRSEMTHIPVRTVRDEVSVVDLLRVVIRFTFGAELAGAILLFVQLAPSFGVERAAWHAVFHSVSAFCNAGFSTFSDSLVSFQSQPGILLVISALVIVGGLGFLAVTELNHWWLARRVGRRRRVSSHTTTVLLTTLGLLVGGAALFSVFEWNGTLAGMSIPNRLMNAWFLSVTPRTAGFNTIDYGHLGNDASYLTIILMMIGGAPGSTAGGVKVTVVSVLVAMGVCRLRGRRYVSLHGRAVPPGTLDRAVNMALLAFVVVSAAVFVLSAMDGRDLGLGEARRDFLPLMFEAASAFATCGLSMGFTSSLGDPSKVVVTVLMFVGRVGLLSFFTALTVRGARLPAHYRPAQEDVMIG